MNEIPKPDWSQAPSWARWWAVNASGFQMWFRKEPQYLGHRWCRKNGDDSMVEFGFKTVIPLGTDWRTLVEKRPDDGKE